MPNHCPSSSFNFLQPALILLRNGSAAEQGADSSSGANSSRSTQEELDSASSEDQEGRQHFIATNSTFVPAMRHLDFTDFLGRGLVGGTRIRGDDMSQQEQHSIERGGDDLPSIRGTLFPYPDVAHNFSQNQVAIEAGGGTVLSVLTPRQMRLNTLRVLQEAVRVAHAADDDEEEHRPIDQ